MIKNWDERLKNRNISCHIDKYHNAVYGTKLFLATIVWWSIYLKCLCVCLPGKEVHIIIEKNSDAYFKESQLSTIIPVLRVNSQALLT